MNPSNNRDLDYVAAILDHCDRIEEILKRLDHSKNLFDSDPVFQDAINMNIFQIGELSNQISDVFKENMPDIPWHEMYGARNVIAHGYIKVDKSMIWDTCKKDIPTLKQLLEAALDQGG